MRHRIGLAVGTGRTWFVGCGQDHHQRNRYDDYIPAQNQDDEPQGKLLRHSQSDKGGIQQQFVRQGVEDSAERRLLSQTAGQQPVHPIAQSGNQYQNECGAILPVEDRQDDKGDEHQAQQRQLI